MSDGAGKYKRLLRSAIETLSRVFHDNYCKKNADFRSKAGLKSVVIREEIGDCCNWCADIAGTYDYENAPKEVWQRHAHCRCMVITRTEKGTYQDAWSRREYQNEREARIAREEEIIAEQNNQIDPKSRVSAAVVAQDGGKAKKPHNMIGNYEDYMPLNLSDKEKAVFSELHQLTELDGYEHGMIIPKRGQGIPCNSYKEGMVEMPISSLDEVGLKLYHSHTNDTPPSKVDLSKLLIDKVEAVGTVTRNRDVFVVSVGNGWIPSQEDFDRIVEKITEDVNTSIVNSPGFWEMTTEERNYVAIREQFFQTSRFFGWDVKGGALDEQ